VSTTAASASSAIRAALRVDRHRKSRARWRGMLGKLKTNDEFAMGSRTRARAGPVVNPLAAARLRMKGGGGGWDGPGGSSAARRGGRSRL